MITQEQFDQISNCRESLAYVARQPSLAAAWNNCDRADWLLDFARKAKIASKEQFVRVALGEAEVVLHIWTAKYPDDDRPQKAITAAKDYLGDQTSALRAAASAAAAAASAAADAAFAAYDASASSSSSSASSAYASSASSAAFAASTAADAAANAAEDKDAFRRAQCDRIRAIIHNPFVGREIQP